MNFRSLFTKEKESTKKLKDFSKLPKPVKLLLCNMSDYYCHVKDEPGLLRYKYEYNWRIGNKTGEYCRYITYLDMQYGNQGDIINILSTFENEAKNMMLKDFVEYLYEENT